MNTLSNLERQRKIEGSANESLDQAHESIRQIFECRKKMAIDILRMDSRDKNRDSAIQMMEECNQKLKEILFI